MLQIQCLHSKIQEANALYTRFAIGPLKPGQGFTIGNALRRVLLSDLQGLAIVGVRISGVNHEFSTVQDLKEDVIDILLNLKQIVLKGYLKEPTLLRLVYHGPGIITAKDIELSEGISLIEPNHYIATASASKTIEMEFLIKNGSGYSICSTPSQIPEGFLGIDAVYMPVKKVNFFIETSNDNTISENLESLIFEIQTDGSITPLEALNQGSEILQTIFDSLRSKGLPSQAVRVSEDDSKKDNNDRLSDVMIEELELSVRAFNCLKRANIHTLSDLLSYSQEDLLEFKNFGQKSADEVCLNLKAKFGKVLN